MGDISKDIQSKFPNNKIKALLNIKYTANWINSKQIAFFKPFGISPQQYNILRILRGADDKLKAQTIKERMVERAPNATRLMDKLCDKQLTTRERCEHDRRVVYVNITEKGLALLNDIDSKIDSNPLKNLTVTEAQQLSDLLDKIR